MNYIPQSLSLVSQNFKVDRIEYCWRFSEDNKDEFIFQVNKDEKIYIILREINPALETIKEEKFEKSYKSTDEFSREKDIPMIYENFISLAELVQLANESVDYLKS